MAGCLPHTFHPMDRAKLDGMVAAAHPLASAAGVGVLADGANAFPAAVPRAATLNVVEPFMSGVGGIGIALSLLFCRSILHGFDGCRTLPVGGILHQLT